MSCERASDCKRKKVDDIPRSAVNVRTPPLNNLVSNSKLVSNKFHFEFEFKFTQVYSTQNETYRKLINRITIKNFQEL